MNQGNTGTSHGQTHHTDPQKQSEHLALLDIVPTDQATHVAVQNGSWFDPATWGGSVPDADARVWIPENITVDYDEISEVRLFTVRVDGELEFATHAETQIILDTLVVAPKGTLTIGDETNPVSGNVNTRILIADNGAIDRVWDPTQISRGVISHGTINIHGQRKTSHLKVDIDPLAGDRTLDLEAIPENWQVGDRVLITGTRYRPYTYSSEVNDWVYPGSEDEQRVITAIDGDRITLDRALTYDHTTPKADLKAYVANQSRNIVIETENAANLPANQRGHVMLMHSDDIDVRYAEFKELGRTDKSKLLDDFEVDQDSYERLLDANGNPIKGQSDNIRGRYALHLHRTGVNEAANPAVLVGNSVDGSPGWGITQHDSYAILENNLTYNVAGSGFVSETGNEKGAWRNNISISNIGGRDDNEKIGVGNQDQGFAGHGFWFQSRLVENEGNVTAGNRGSGIFYFHRGVDQIEVLQENLPITDWSKGQKKVDTSDPPILGFKDNEVFASESGLRVIKNFQRQEHDGRTVLDGLTAWEVVQGSELQYTAHYTLKDFRLIGAENIQRDWLSDGFNLAQNTEDIVFDQLQVEGFERGVNLHKELAGEEPWDDWGYIWVDDDVKNNGQNWINFDASRDRRITRDDVNEGQLSFEIDADPKHLIVTGHDDGYFASIEGIKTDSLGDIEASFGSERLGFQYDGIDSLVAEGFYTLPDGTRGIIVDEYFSDRLTGDSRKYSFFLTFADDFWTRDVPNLGPVDLSQLNTPSAIIEFEDMTLDIPSIGEGEPPQPPINPNPPTPPTLPPVIGEYGQVSVDQDWSTVTLQNRFINPIVIVSDPSDNNDVPLTARLRNVGRESFQLRFQEPNYADGIAPSEFVSYLVLEQGDWQLADGTQISAGVHQTNRLSSKGFDTIQLSGFENDPTVLSQVQTFNGSDWVTTRLKNPTSNSFQLAMQEEEARNRGGHLNEELGWVAIGDGSAFDTDPLLQFGTTRRTVNHTVAEVQFDQAFENAPILIAKLGSTFGGDTANLAIEDLALDGFGARVREEQSRDLELGHTKESVSFLALAGESGTINGWQA